MESVNFDISLYEYSPLYSEHNDARVIFRDNIGFGARRVRVSMWRDRKCYACVYMLLKGFNIAVAFPLPVMKALIKQGQSSDWQPVIKNPIPGHICAKQREARTGFIKDIISTCFGKKFTMQQACIWNQNNVIAPAGLRNQYLYRIVPQAHERVWIQCHATSPTPLVLHERLLNIWLSHKDKYAESAQFN